MAKFTTKHAAAAKVETEKSLSALIKRMIKILAPERSFYVLAIIYGVGISLLSLATPVSVQILVNSVVNTGLTTPLVVISITLFVLLMLYGMLNALRIQLMDVFGRRFYARMVSDISLRTIYAVNPFFDDAGKSALFNRFFDIIIVMKVVPYLLVGGFTLFAQAFVGFLLVSFYHPYFLAFNLFIIFLLVMLWMIWGKRAMHSAVELSHRKHATAGWLEGIGDSNGFYNSGGHIAEALKQTELYTAEYIQQHITHFRHHFSQTIGFFFIYAFGSAVLLGLGGWLVLQSQLNIGQLVAAELILSVVFFGIAQFGVYLTYFYDLCGAIDELSLFYDVEQEDSMAIEPRLTCPPSLAFSNVIGKKWNKDVLLDFSIPANSRVLVRTEDPLAEQLFVDVLKGQEQDYGGFFSIGGVDSHAIAYHALRREVLVLDRPRIVGISIRNYLNLSDDDVASEQLLEVIDIVGLNYAISKLEEGIDTVLAVTGWPLSVVEVMQLKLAAAIIARPKILVLGELYDVITEAILKNSLDFLQQRAPCTVLYLSNHSPNIACNYLLYLNDDKQKVIEVKHSDTATSEPIS